MNKNPILSSALLVSILLSMPATSYAGISIGGTRVIYPGDQKEVPLSVKNSSDGGVFLIRSWAENNTKTDTKKPPFVITPPLFRIDPGQENVLRLSQTNTAGLPQDHESLYWLNVMAVPPAADKNKNGLQFSLNTKIKLIYRPAALNDLAEVNNAWKNLEFVSTDQHVTVKNPTPYYISVFKMKIGGVEVKDKNITIPPKGAVTVTPSVPGHNVQWSAINDNGGVTAESNKQF